MIEADEDNHRTRALTGDQGNTHMITIDGANGGGQVLRTSLALSLVTGEPFRITSIRGKRPKPGLMRQHLVCVEAALAVGGGSADGAALGSRELVFHPGTPTPRDFAFAIGTAGSTSLVLQTVLPALVAVEGRSTVTVSGGTHNPMAPTSDFLDRSFLPLIRRMGAGVKLQLRRHGFAPAGGGVVVMTVDGGKPLQPLKIKARGKEQALRVLAKVAHVPDSVAERECKTATEKLGWSLDSCAIEHVESDGPGNCVAVEIAHTNVTHISTAFGERGRAAEQVAEKAAKGAHAYSSSAALFDERLGDQMMLPFAITGAGRFTVPRVTNHITTNARVIESFLDGQFTIGDPVGIGPVPITWNPGGSFS